MGLFKGYVPTKDKKCLMSFKNKSSDELKTLREVSDLSEYAGVLDDNTVLIDVDDYEQSEILMDIVEDLQLRCRVYETTRGKHFLFLNNGRIDKNAAAKDDKRLACGLESDIKLGKRCSYSILKYNGADRKIIYDIFPDEQYETVPKWLTPIKTKMTFLDMDEGDGRNQSLFNYILTLQSNDFSIEESRETLSIINKYILQNPLEENELNTLMRDDAFKKPVFFKGSTFLFDKFAMFIKNNANVKRINDQLHVYKNGIYVCGQQEIEAEMIKHIPTLNRAKRTEVLTYLNLLVRDNYVQHDANLIAFKNGIYDVDSDTMKEFGPESIITNKINFDYVPDAYCEVTDKTLDKIACNDKEIRSLLEEVIGYCFYRRNELRKAFVLIGDKKNGKSTYLFLIQKILGEDNVASLDLKELSDRFSPASLFGKLANIGDDIGDEFIPNAAMFKKIVSGDAIKGERKGQDEFFFNPYCKLLFSANSMPRIKDKSGAVIDRLIIVPFNARFSKDDPDFDPYIKYKLIQKESLQYLIKLGVEGLKRIMENQSFTMSKKVEKTIEEYNESNNPILLFFKEIEIDDILNEPTKDVYKKYTEFCLSNTFTPMSNIEFSKQVKKQFDLEIVNKTISGKKYRIFVKG